MSSGLHSLATIIKRLEAATSRLEDLAQHGSGQVQQPTTTTEAPPVPSSDASKGPVAVEDPRSVKLYDENVVNGKLVPWVQLSHTLGGPVDEQAKLVAKQFSTLRAILLMAAACKKPTQEAFGELLGPLQQDIQAITKIKEDRRFGKEWFNHLTTVSEGASCVGWITLDSKPAPFVGEIKESARFYANRVIKEFKDTNAKHVEWANSYLAIIEELKKYVLECHTTGLTWNPKGVDVSKYTASGTTAAAPSAPAPPPPPPPPPPSAAPTPAAAAPAGPAAVLAELNRGADVTKGLRKVDRSEMTHKNPELRASSVVPASASSSGGQVAPKRPSKPSKPSSLAGKKPGKFVLEGNKWLVEYQENESSLVIGETEINQVVNLFGCKNTVVQIKGKVNAVSLVNCTKTSVLVDNVISSISVTSSPSFALQVTGVAPTIQLDSTDSGQIYLSKACLGVEITTAKCSSINVSIPDENEEEGVFVERAVPEMMRTVVKDGKLITTIVEHSA
ncbi:hypothetical protein SISNIDRAFT_403150 [Sistotremastrum niveocremeum HHB9708]|uniref:Adenylyl cyclase-associated protein n=1 Tax=Sistotremastrum niveocremeum HHB9708 TaxID=1314777 RepID=A0A165AHC2_9AGAM|nr:hypothetical protein SISNIDRAFT_403150 [Sistotremastrum niveocremeum HHB9708]